MKKTIIALISALVIVAVGIIIYNGVSAQKITGRALVAQGGTYIIVDDDDSAIVMTNLSDDDALFEGIKNGYKIKITCDAVAESYPGQAGVYKCQILEEGTISDVSESVVSKLENMGWKF